MATKLTLSLDKEIIERAKVYAKEHNVSLSYPVENYLLRIISELPAEKPIGGSIVRQLTGIVSLEEDDYRAVYMDHQRKKHQ